MANFRDRPTSQVDNFVSGPPSRAGRYSEAYSLPMTAKEWVVADEGSYFVAITPTPGTGIIGHATPTTFDETKPYLLVYNGGNNRIYPQFLRMHETVASIGGTGLQMTIAVDQGNRFSSGGTALTKSNVNMDSVNTTAATITVGAVVASAASSSRRVLGHYVLRPLTLIDIIEDEYQLTWGAPDAFLNAVPAATVSNIQCTLPPMVIGPGQSLLVHEWRASQSTGPTWEVVFGYIER